MTPIVAFCYNYHFSGRTFHMAFGEEIVVEDPLQTADNYWLGVNSGRKHHTITVKETNEFLRKYLK